MNSPDSRVLFKFNVCFTVGASGCIFDNQMSCQTCSHNNKSVLLFFLISVTDVLTAPGWKPKVGYCGAKLNFISPESNRKYFSDTELQQHIQYMHMIYSALPFVQVQF